MSEVSTRLVDYVLPHAPVRQWTPTFPHASRYWMAANRKLIALVHRRISSMIQLYCCNKADERGLKMPEAGGVSFVQKFGAEVLSDIALAVANTVIKDLQNSCYLSDCETETSLRFPKNCPRLSMIHTLQSESLLNPYSSSRPKWIKSYLRKSSRDRSLGR